MMNTTSSRIVSSTFFIAINFLVAGQSRAEYYYRYFDEKIPLTVCPLSNIELRVYDKLEDHPIKTMLDRGLIVSVNSDDPSYFGGYCLDNYRAIAKAFQLSKEDIGKLAANAIDSTFLYDVEKAEFHADLKAALANFD